MSKLLYPRPCRKSRNVQAGKSFLKQPRLIHSLGVVSDAAAKSTRKMLREEIRGTSARIFWGITKWRRRERSH
jgi:hypothetical protein